MRVLCSFPIVITARRAPHTAEVVRGSSSSSNAKSVKREDQGLQFRRANDSMAVDADLDMEGDDDEGVVRRSATAPGGRKIQAAVIVDTSRLSVRSYRSG
jgi:hypothetical protein